MLSRFVASTLVVVLCAGFVLAGEYTGVVTKCEDGKVTFTTYKNKKKGDTMTLKVAKSAKITKGEDEVKVDDFHKMVAAAAEGKGRMKGVRATITTEGEGDKEMVTKVAISKGKKKKE